MYNRQCEYDYFAEGDREDFYAKFDYDSFLVHGKHWDVPPAVTIILCTYKRPNLLKEALDSALNQVGYDDYQIIVADNEGVDINTETPTSHLMKQYIDDKVIYYRHEKEVSFKMDSAVRFARSKWICFLHDDDMLAENHLSTMMTILEKNHAISYLSCPSENFTEETSEDVMNRMIRGRIRECNLYCYPRQYVCMAYWPGWLGAVIDRENYINMGGMPRNGNNHGDTIMMCKYLYRYRTLYFFDSKVPLYIRRNSNVQVSAGGTDVWKRIFVHEYIFQQYVNRVYHPILYRFWDRIYAYIIKGKCERWNRGYYKTKLVFSEIAEEAGISNDLLKRKWRRKTDELLLQLYRRWITGQILNNLFKVVKIDKIIIENDLEV